MSPQSQLPPCAVRTAGLCLQQQPCRAPPAAVRALSACAPPPGQWLRCLPPPAQPDAQLPAVMNDCGGCLKGANAYCVAERYTMHVCRIVSMEATKGPLQAYLLSCDCLLGCRL